MIYLLSGGAGFIGSHTARKLLESSDSKVIVFDNLSSGTLEHISDLINDKNFIFIEGDLKDKDKIISASAGVDCVIHFAANPDIAKAVKEPEIDFWEGTYLTQNVLEAARVNNVKYFLYTSGSGVYGENPDINFDENYGPCIPISTYGASKLACEALIASYCSMFGLKARAFRFANVVGPRQTHGVGYDFIRKLKGDPTRLEILGDGTQIKSYIYVADVIDAMLNVFDSMIHDDLIYDIFNVSTDDYITVTDIAQLTCKLMNLDNVTLDYTGGNRGWKGDVPIIKFNNSKIKELGWSFKFSSKEAIMESLSSMINEV